VIAGAVVFGIGAAVLFGFAGFFLKEGVSDRDGLMYGISALMAFIGVICAGAAYSFYWVDGRTAQSEVDRAHAQPCAAEIINMEDLHGLVNDNRLYRFRLRVQVTGKNAYEADSTDAVSPLTLGRIGAGRMKFDCVTDRRDPTQVEVLWERPITEPSPSPQATDRN
jgi:hypothetical protein